MPSVGELVQLGAQQVQDLADLGRRAAGVHAEVAGIGVGGGEGVGGVDQAALLADLLEQPGGHAAAEDGVEHAHDVAAVVGGDDRGAAHDDVGLLHRHA